MYLESLAVKIEEARLIKLDELEALGCDKTNLSCSSAPSWVYSTSYWTGEVCSSDYVCSVLRDGQIGNTRRSYESGCGVRPVIVISKFYF